MIFRQLFDTDSSTYTYLLADEETKDAILIDTVFEKHARDAALLRELGLKLRYTLDTHCHADHVTGAWLMRAAFDAKIAMAKAIGAENVDITLAHGDKIEFGKYSVEVRATPGHTDGCLTYVTNDGKRAFTGDALLIRGAGRTDFQQGDASTLFRSIQEQIFSLSEETLLYPGHDYSGRTVTTVGEEKLHNARIGGEASEGDFVGYMENLGLPHPRKIDVAVPGNMVAGKPSDDAPSTPEWGPVVINYAGLPNIAPEWVAAHRDEVVILDVRAPLEESKDEFGVLEGTLDIPLDDLRDRIAEVPTGKPIVALCRSGRRSGMATVILKKAGYDKVANIAGGMARWRAEGLPS